MTTRDYDFAPKDKLELALRAGFHCSNPDCRRLTAGPGKTSADGSIKTGEAAHIHSGSEDGPRYDESIGREKLKSAIDNGIWLCDYDAELVDKNDGSGYSADLLRAWRSDHEAWARAEIEGTDPSSSHSPLVADVDPGDLSCIQDRFDHPQQDLQLRVRVRNSGGKALKEVTCRLVERRPYAVPGFLRVMNDNTPPYQRSNTGINLQPGHHDYFDVAFHRQGEGQVVFEYAENYLRNVEQGLNPMGPGVYFLTLELDGVRTDNGNAVTSSRSCFRLDADPLREMRLSHIPCGDMPEQSVVFPATHSTYATTLTPKLSTSASAVFEPSHE